MRNTISSPPIPAWSGEPYSLNATVLTAVFDASFRDFRPTTTARWFYWLKLLKSIEGLEHLNTSQVTDMGGMFRSCESLAALDLSSFDTSKVKYVRGMFEDCKGLTTLDLSNFDTSKLTSIRDMFRECKSLTSLVSLQLRHFKADGYEQYVLWMRIIDFSRSLQL